MSGSRVAARGCAGQGKLENLARLKATSSIARGRQSFGGPLKKGAEKPSV